MSKFKIAVVLLVLFVVTAMLVGSLLDFVPWDYRRWFGIVLIPIVLFLLVPSWRKWRLKERGDRNEMDWLHEVVDEQERGVRDNRRLIRMALPDIEHDHQSTPELKAIIERARHAIDN